MNIAKNTVVQINYTLKDKSGEVLDASEENTPFTYIQGNGVLVKGLEEELEGKCAGTKFETMVTPEKGYGLRSESKVHVVPASGFQPENGQPLVEGLQVKVETEDGIVLGDVAKIDGDNVTLDLNHPLAGEELHFTVEVIDVRNATEQELSPVEACGSGCGCC